MRTLWIVLLALLLPLRLMASDAMAVHMMASGNPQELHEVQVSAAPDHGDMAMPADCAGHAASDAFDNTAPNQSPHCPTCSHCQACSAVVMVVNIETALKALAPSAPPAMPAPAFSSTELAPDLKPPIS